MVARKMPIWTRVERQLAALFFKFAYALLKRSSSYFTWQDVPLNRVSFYGTNHVTLCPFLTGITRQGIMIDKKIMRQEAMYNGRFFNSVGAIDHTTVYTSWAFVMRHRLQGVERFSKLLHHFFTVVKYPPPGFKHKI